MLEKVARSGQHRDMKNQISFRIVVAAAALALLAGCAMFQESGQSALVGTWTNSLGTVWAIRADGTFDVDLKHHGKRDAWGTYTVQGDQVTLQRTGGVKPKGCEGPGVYKFKRTDDTLQFTLVSDQCKLRQKNVLQPWKPWKKK
ncbi:MAG: hypothetical protein DMF35_01645 [Verrucomicrobia bacterium]|nr:MAG: hypothetical protein DME41_04595 [Verrucomicrobiota bacterium]PYL36295.1 MAG: hypothetical protein DMF35_01645 [Verrucomicrobiota bacterium]PYL95593.1 MAG: hypothetical protein DME28_02020 [Verrucomicrobiota bacterium]